jgi:hypothetical protein
VTELLDPSVG